MSKQFSFKLENTDNRARAGIFNTPHGEIQTPIFMPVGTNSSVKMLTNHHLEEAGANIILSNSYHLYLNPSHSLIERAGGLHKWMNWNKPILTDSGGFQVFSLAHLREIEEKGVSFKNPKNGDKHFISPEKSMEIQNSLGADIIMAFDECAPYPCSHSHAKDAMNRTHRWLERCFQAHNNPNQALFPIVQGSTYDDLREISAKEIASYDAIGYAIGGVSVGENSEEKNRATEISTKFLPENKPRYLMGVGTPEDLLEGVKRGVDMFDCVMPTRIARHGAFFTNSGRGNIKNAAFTEDYSPLDEGCNCYACKNHSKAYIRHLFRQNESTASILMSIHNVHFLIDLMRQARTAILKGHFEEFYRERLPS